MPYPLNLLILEDRASDAELLIQELRSAGFDPVWDRVETEQDYLAHLNPTLDLILADYSLPQFDGLRALQLLHERGLDIPFILVSGAIGEERAVTAMRSGVSDYLLKDRLARLGQAVEHALHEKQLRLQKRQSDEQLAKSRHRFQALIEHAPDGIALLGPDLELEYVSPSSKSILGYSIEDVIGWEPERLTHPDDLEMFFLLMERAFRAPGRSLPANYRARHRDGTWRWLEGTVTNLLDEPDVRALVFNYRDITQRKQAEEQIRYQANLIETVSDAIISTDANYMIQSWNRAAEVIYGWQSDEVVGIHPVTILQSFQTPEERMRAEKMLLETGSWRGQVVQRRKDGRLIHILGSVSLVRDEKQNVIGMVAVNRDISAQVEAEEAAAASEVKFRALIEKSAEGILLVDATGTVLYVSASTTRIMGGDPERWVGMNWLTRIHPQDLQMLSTLFESLLPTRGLSETAQFRIQHLDGRWLWLEGNVTNLLDEPGVGAIVTNFRDITARKRTEEALRRGEERFRRYFEQGLIGMAITSPTKGILEVNTYLCELLQYSREELRQKSWADLTHPDDLAQDIALFDRAMRGELDRYTLDKRYIRKDGTVLYTTLSANYVRGADAEQSYFVVLVQDITERKRAEEALRRSEVRFRRYFELGLVGMAITSPTKGILEVNNHLCELLQYSHEELLQMNWADITHPDDRAQDNALFEQVMRGELDRYSIDKRYIRKDGTDLDVTISVNYVRGADITADYFVGLVQDITERKKAEEATRRRLAELEAVNRISAALRTMQTLDEMLPMLLDESLAVLGETIGRIWLYDAARDRLNLVAQRGGPPIPLTVLERGQGIPGLVMETLQAYVSHDFSTDPRAPAMNHALTPEGYGGVCLPIVSGTGLSGVLCVLMEALRELSAAEINLLMVIAEIAGSAIHRMRLNAQTELQVQHLAALRTIDMAISGSMDLNIILNILIEQVVSQLNVDAACVMLLNPQLHTFEYSVGRGFRTRAIEHSHYRLGQGPPGRAALEGQLITISDLEAAPAGEHFQPLSEEAFVSYYGVPLIAKGRVTGVLEIFHRARLDPDPAWMDFLHAFAGQAAIAIDSATLFEEIQRSNTELSLAYDATIEGWSRALDLRDRETEGHSERVTEITMRLAHKLDLDDEQLVHLRRGALLHDIGKMGVPDNILLKPGPLTDEERERMEMHPVYAYELLRDIGYLHKASEIPYAHHEKWDGTGYPRGLAGEQIPLAARIFAVVDVWDALRSDRPYRSGWSDEQVREYLVDQRGKQFDPHVVDAFLELDLSL